MKILNLIIFCGFLISFSCTETKNEVKLKSPDCNNFLSHLSLPVFLDSLYSLSIETFSLLEDSVKVRSNGPCVTDQKIVFKLGDSVINIKTTPIVERVTDSINKCYFLRYTITGIASDIIGSKEVYMLYLYAANGEAEYNIYYDKRGMLLFYQRCYKDLCTVKCYNHFDEKIAINHTNNNNRKLNILSVKGTCY